MAKCFHCRVTCLAAGFLKEDFGLCYKEIGMHWKLSFSLFRSKKELQKAEVKLAQRGVQLKNP